MTDNRQIRVFISSTFRDMMRERDLLVKEVFPALRRKCAKRFVTFTEVDLRWGITEEQANEGQVLPLCLAEIERSRPYFIGLLGERYGWIPDTIQTEVIEREPWLKEHVQGRTSVTELEIHHGVLNNPAMRHHAQGDRMAISAPCRLRLGAPRNLPHRHPTLPLSLQPEDAMTCLCAWAVTPGRWKWRFACGQSSRTARTPASSSAPTPITPWRKHLIQSRRSTSQPATK